jgi:hypothetical protein
MTEVSDTIRKSQVAAILKKAQAGKILSAREERKLAEYDESQKPKVELTTEQAAERFGIAIRNLRLYATLGAPHRFELNGKKKKMLWPEAELQDWMIRRGNSGETSMRRARMATQARHVPTEIKGNGKEANLKRLYAMERATWLDYIAAVKESSPLDHVRALRKEWVDVSHELHDIESSFDESEKIRKRILGEVIEAQIEWCRPIKEWVQSAPRQMAMKAEAEIKMMFNQQLIPLMNRSSQK